MSKSDVLGRSGEDYLGLVVDFATKLHSGAITSGEAKRFLRKENPWPVGVIQAIPFDPVIFLGKKDWTIVEQDERSLKLTEVDLSGVKLEPSLGPNTIGEENLEHLKQMGYIRLDARFLVALHQHHGFVPGLWKEKTDGNTTHIFFNGTILRDPAGRRYSLYLYWTGELWEVGIKDLGGWLVDGPSLVLTALNTEP